MHVLVTGAAGSIGFWISPVRRNERKFGRPMPASTNAITWIGHLLSRAVDIQAAYRCPADVTERANQYLAIAGEERAHYALRQRVERRISRLDRRLPKLGARRRATGRTGAMARPRRRQLGRPGLPVLLLLAAIAFAVSRAMLAQLI